MLVSLQRTIAQRERPLPVLARCLDGALRVIDAFPHHRRAPSADFCERLARLDHTPRNAARPCRSDNKVKRCIPNRGMPARTIPRCDDRRATDRVLDLRSAPRVIMASTQRSVAAGAEEQFGAP